MVETGTCLNCEYAFPRCKYSYDHYGAYDHGYECLMVDGEAGMYKRFDDSCDKFKLKNEGNSCLKN